VNLQYNVAVENCATPYLFISLSNIRENRQYKHSKNIAGAPALGTGGKKSAWALPTLEILTLV